MAAPDIKPHVDAIHAALVAAGLAVGDGVAPAAIPSTGIYAVLYCDPGQSLTESLADERTDFVLGFQVTVVGPTPEKVRWASQRVRAGLHGALTVAGRRPWRPEEQGGPPIQRDEDVSPPLWYLPIQYELKSTAA
ncbi:hypothetical protein [Streptomyces sp. NPDC127040]|uniref:hypothetical protein n=1 Tax=Streptomyces sp. NPDC127040 TaxID=3347116 RepID=UPI0036635901